MLMSMMLAMALFAQRAELFQQLLLFRGQNRTDLFAGIDPADQEIGLQVRSFGGQRTDFFPIDLITLGGGTHGFSVVMEFFPDRLVGFSGGGHNRLDPLLLVFGQLKHPGHAVHSTLMRLANTFAAVAGAPVAVSLKRHCPGCQGAADCEHDNQDGGDEMIFHCDSPSGCFRLAPDGE
jgi:hypothetical protein